MKKILLSLCFGAFMAVYAHANTGIFTYSGGNGSPLTVTLDSPIQFTIGSSPIESQNVVGFWNFTAFPTSQPFEGMLPFSSNITLSDSASGNIPISIFKCNVGGNNLGFYAVLPSDYVFPAGDVVTLSAGTATTLNPVDFPTPLASNTYLVENNTMQLMAILTDVPEPSSIALFGIGAAGVALLRRKASK